MFELNFFKKSSYVLTAATLIFSLSACSPKADPIPASEAAPIPASEQSAGESKTETPTAAEPQAAENGSSSGMVIDYENKEYGLSMKFPSEWAEPEEKINENGLTVISATEEFDNSIMVLVRDIPSETSTLEEYKEANTSGLEELYDLTMVEMNEIVTLNDVDFLKVVVADTTPEEESHQIIYTSFENGYAYEIVITLSPDYYIANADIFDEIEKSIQLVGINTP